MSGTAESCDKAASLAIEDESSSKDEYRRRLTALLCDGPASIAPGHRFAKNALNRWTDHWSEGRALYLSTVAVSAETRERLTSELARIDAVLALSTPLPSGDAHAAETAAIHRGLKTVNAWLLDVIRRSNDPTDSYFFAYRVRDACTYAGTVGRGDPFVEEVLQFLFEDGRTGRKLHVLFTHGDNRLLKHIERWLRARGEFGCAYAVARAAENVRPPGSSAPVHESMEQGFAWRAFVSVYSMPRLVASTLVGHLAILSEDRVAKWVTWFAHSPGSFIGYNLLTLALCGALITAQMRRRSPWRDSHAKPVWTIVCLGLLQSLIVAWVLQSMAATDGPEYLELPDATSMPAALLCAATSALALGYLLQVLWDERSVAEDI